MLKRTLLWPSSVVAVAVLLFGVQGGLAATPDAAGSAVLESPTGAYFVGLNGSVDAFRSKAKANGLQFSERFQYSRAWNGLSVAASADTAKALSKVDGVTSVWPVYTAQADPLQVVSEPDIMHAVEMTGADIAQNELRLTGAGVKVAVMDTGIDYNNPAFGACSAIGGSCRIAKGWDFVGDSFDGSGSGGSLIPHPDNDPDDCNGHGSHVAGIIGANGTVNGVALKGVAPGVTFGAYRVFGCEGSTTADIMLAAMDRALADDMQVLNMSIGSAFVTWPQYPTAVGADALVDQGMVVVASIGNSGANGIYSAGAPGVGRKVIGVASVDNKRVELKTFKAAPDNAAFGYMQATASPDAPTSGTAALTRTGTPTTTNDGCNVSGASPFAAGSLTGKIALIRRGTCTFWEKSLNAQNAGAAGVILYNNAAGLFAATVAPQVPGGAPITIPVVSISDMDGATLSGRIPTAMTDTVEITWTDEVAIFDNPTAGRASSFTSYGLTAELDVKPDIAAPGGLIKSAWPMENGGVATISGTSMSSPHVAGASALLLGGGVPANQVKTRLMNSADPILFGTNPTALLDPVQHQGAGLVDIDDAFLADTLVSPVKIALGEGTAGTAEISVQNNSSAEKTYTIAHQRAVGTFGSSFAPPSFTTTGPTVTPSTTSLVVPAGETRTFTVNWTAPDFGAQLLYGGYIRITSGGVSYRVPYAGFNGDYQSIQVIAPGGCNFPGIFKAGGETTCAAGPPAVKLTGWTKQAAGATFDVEQQPDRPVLLFHLAHQSRRLEIRAVDAAGREYLVAFDDYNVRNSTNDRAETGYFVYRWDGKAIFESTGGLNRRELANGVYRLKLVVTEAQALNESGPASTEVWTSDPFTITRTS